MAAHGYSWENYHAAPSYRDDSQSWRLRWWILLAVLLSIFLHVLLFFAFSVIRVTGLAGAFGSPELDDRPMRVERVSIDPAKLQNLDDISLAEGAPEQSVEQAAQESFLDAQLEKIEMEEQAAVLREIVATPLVDKVQNLAPPAAGETPAETSPLEALAAEMESRSAEDITRELDSVREELIKNSQVSAAQAIMELGGSEASLDDAKADLLKELVERTADQTGAGTRGVPEGYADLDDLLSYDGPAVDLNKPIMMPTDLLFDYNEATLKEGAKLSLMKLGFLIQKNPGATFIIQGHSDSFGSDAYNVDLSRRRAFAVVDWLVGSLKLDRGQMKAEGFGSANPIADPGGTIEEQALNRRVEIVVR
ncbi:hypothetical protein BH23VER1_BH23VER1_09250 [soil metagenome]